VNDATSTYATPDVAEDATDHATTPHDVTSRYATVREAAEIMGVSSETIRRMIRDGRLRGQKVHRPQGTAFLVEMSDVTVEATPDAARDVTAGRHNVTDGASLSPALLAAEAWARGVVEPLTRTIVEQQHQLVTQAETIGTLRAERDAARAELAAAHTPESPPEAPTATVAAEPASKPLRLFFPLWDRWWPLLPGFGMALILALVFIFMPR
jgi:excisionase family DNA binding protein